MLVRPLAGRLVGTASFGPARRFYARQGLVCTGERTECVIEGKTLYEVRYVRRDV